MLAIAAGQSIQLSTVTPPSGASPLPHLTCGVQGQHSIYLHTAHPQWERACSRWLCASQYRCRLLHRHREQAPSHICPAVFKTSTQSTCTPHNPCGSGLARDSSGSVNTGVDCYTAIGSKPPPTLDLRRSRPALNLPAHRTTPVGAGLLAMAVCQSIQVSTVTPPPGASPLPHLTCSVKSQHSISLHTA